MKSYGHYLRKSAEDRLQRQVVTIAKFLEIKGYVENLADGRIKVVAEGDEPDLERFAKALVMKNTIIEVFGIETEYSHPTGEYDGFAKMVDSGETDARWIQPSILSRIGRSN